MFYDTDPRQVTMFPELASSAALSSITTQPEFDRALSNLIKICDLGAFVKLSISGIEKGYTINIHDLGIPADFLQPVNTSAPLTVHLFPADVRRQLQKLVYGIKAYFNSSNSISTAFGPFLFRKHFNDWQKFLESERELLRRSIKKMLGKKTYSRYYLDQFSAGYNLFRQTADITAPWEYTEHPTLAEIREWHKKLISSESQISDLDPTDINFPLKTMILKTQHVPLKLVDYQRQIQIISFFKTIHIDHLINININSIDDIRELTDNI